jgi:hypothetical protein
VPLNNPRCTLTRLNIKVKLKMDNAPSDANLKRSASSSVASLLPRIRFTLESVKEGSDESVTLRNNNQDFLLHDGPENRGFPQHLSVWCCVEP